MMDVTELKAASSGCSSAARRRTPMPFSTRIEDGAPGLLAHWTRQCTRRRAPVTLAGTSPWTALHQLASHDGALVYPSG